METGSRQKMMDILKTFRNAMLVTCSHDHHSLRSRPMAVMKVDEGTGDIWFLTSFESSKVEEIKVKPEVCVTMQDERRFLSLSGYATILRNRDKINELWSEEARVFFPRGKDDADLALIQVSPTEAEYWDNEGINGLKFLLEAVKSYVTGTTPVIDQGQHGAVSLNGGR